LTIIPPVTEFAPDAEEKKMPKKVWLTKRSKKDRAPSLLFDEENKYIMKAALDASHTK